jgi:hypothetical protein
MNQLVKWADERGNFVEGSDGKFDPKWVTFTDCMVDDQYGNLWPGIEARYTDPNGEDRAVRARSKTGRRASAHASKP